MSIVLNEYEWAEKMIENRELGKKPVETLNRVAKYYLANRYNKKQIRELLDNFLIQCDPSVSLVHWSDTLDKIVKNSDKFPLIQIEHIQVSKKEMNTIGSLKGKQLQRLAFTLLCAAKYWDSVSPFNNHWANCADKEIMRMANINTSIERQSLMFAELRRLGLIRFSKKIDNLNVQILFSANDAPLINITDFRNLGYQYLKYRGEPYFECLGCGITVKSKQSSRGRPQKYCCDCAVRIHMKQKVESVMRKRDITKKCS